ncbi:MAG: nucleotidyl transferase AbiEii/AbiGii toxin family protein [Actinomycetota bacterium]|nr:nucleotidyl transferase AbiEii/AbiGii toxin family protein [Actinomycetota bacterium]
MATIVSWLPEADGFALAGAGALVLHGYIERETRDLDYFTTPAHQAGVQQLGAALEAALVNEGLESRRLRDLPTFIRLLVGRDPDRCEVDLAIDYRALDVEVTPFGPTLAPMELGANKVLAVLDRAESRDFTDLEAITRSTRWVDSSRSRRARTRGSTAAGSSTRSRRSAASPQPTSRSALRSTSGWEAS